LDLKKPVRLYLKRSGSLKCFRNDAATREFGQLLNFCKSPENFVRLHGRIDIPEKKELAEI